MQKLITWLIYEVTATGAALNGAQIRGRTRKYAVEHNVNMLIENTEDMSNAVRFAVLNQEDSNIIVDFIKSIAIDAHIELVKENVANPVLSKLTINNTDKYTL